MEVTERLRRSLGNKTASRLLRSISRPIFFFGEDYRRAQLWRNMVYLGEVRGVTNVTDDHQGLARSSFALSYMVATGYLWLWSACKVDKPNGVLL